MIGVGPQVGYIFPVSDEYQGYLNLKGYKEFASDHRADGWNTWLSFSISAAPPSNHGAQGADAGAIWQLRPADHFNGETWHLLPCRSQGIATFFEATRLTVSLTSSSTSSVV